MRQKHDLLNLNKYKPESQKWLPCTSSCDKFVYSYLKLTNYFSWHNPKGVNTSEYYANLNAL